MLHETTETFPIGIVCALDIRTAQCYVTICETHIFDSVDMDDSTGANANVQKCL